MTEVDVGNAEQHGESSATSQPVPAGAGQLLRQAREQRQMSVQAMAAALKVPVYKLQALEEDRWDVLTDSVFARALALSICRLLHIPAEPVLAGMPKHAATKLASNPEGINAPYKEKSLRSLMTSSSDSSAGSASKVVAGLLVAVAVGAGLYFLPQWQAAEGQEDAGASALAAAGHAADEPLFMPALQTEPEAPAVEAEPEPESVVEKPQAATVLEVPVVIAEPAENAVASALPAAPAVAGEGRVLRFVATGESWVQVRDAEQQVVMEKILKSGDVYEATVAVHPLQVVVGNARATQLEIDGVAWDLVTSAKNNVARFEVK